jgi:hypothetical protein
MDNINRVTRNIQSKNRKTLNSSYIHNNNVTLNTLKKRKTLQSGNSANNSATNSPNKDIQKIEKLNILPLSINEKIQEENIKNKILSYKKQKLINDNILLETPKLNLNEKMGQAKNDSDYNTDDEQKNIEQMTDEQMENIFENENDNNTIFINKVIKTNINKEIKKDSNDLLKKLVGEGKASQVNAHIRNDEFKKIKMFPREHLDKDSKVIKDCLNIIKYDENKHGNKFHLVNVLKTTIRNTMNSRRGYVKRKIGITMRSK